MEAQKSMRLTHMLWILKRRRRRKDRGLQLRMQSAKPMKLILHAGELLWPQSNAKQYEMP
jgi:hypothetical protein